MLNPSSLVDSFDFMSDMSMHILQKSTASNISLHLTVRPNRTLRCVGRGDIFTVKTTHLSSRRDSSAPDGAWKKEYETKKRTSARSVMDECCTLQTPFEIWPASTLAGVLHLTASSMVWAHRVETSVSRAREFQRGGRESDGMQTE